MINIIIQSFKMSIQNIIGNKMRSFLTMLGIIIGVSSVIGLITIMEGATATVMGEFNSLGSGTIIVSAPGTVVKRGLTEADIEGIRKIEGIETVLPTASLEGKAAFNDNVYDNVTIEGQISDYFIKNKTKDGRGFLASEESGETMVCVVDKTFVKKIMKGSDVIGNSVIINGYTYKIIGISGDDSSLFGGYSDDSNSNGSVIIPYKNALIMSGAQNITRLYVNVKEGVPSNEVEAKLRVYLKRVFNDNDKVFAVMSMDSLMDAVNSVTGIMSGLLAGIASIALVVGGIGIMNMMLVSVTERTKEIGLRKALGAEPSRIQMQFLIESVVLSLVGGAIGIMLGLLIALGGSALMKSEFVISSSAIMLGVGFSVGVGVLFGWMPAKKASELNPIDALRSE